MPSNRVLRRVTITSVALVAVVGLASGCSSGSSASSASSTTGTSITIKDFKFSPTPLTAKVGSSITVTNDDGTDHELKENDGSFDTGRFSSGSKSFTVSKAGTFAYHCDVHTYMTGVIQITDS
jgi:plastocyanin